MTTRGKLPLFVFIVVDVDVVVFKCTVANAHRQTHTVQSAIQCFLSHPSTTYT